MGSDTGAMGADATRYRLSLRCKPLMYGVVMQIFIRSIFAAFLVFSLMLLVTTSAAAKPVFDDGFERFPATWASGGSNYLWYGDDGQCQQESRDA